MNFFDSISNGIKNHFDKNQKHREMMDQLQEEADAQRLMTFKEEFSRNAKEVAISQAKKEAAEMSGLRKLRATSRARNLSSQEPEPGSFFEKLGDYTKKNKARMQANLERTAEIRKVAEEEKQKGMQGRIRQREQRRSASFGNSTWKM